VKWGMWLASAVSADGQFEGGMGVDAADTTGMAGWILVVAHLDMQLARLYRNMVTRISVTRHSTMPR